MANEIKMIKQKQYLIIYFDFKIFETNLAVFFAVFCFFPPHIVLVFFQNGPSL